MLSRELAACLQRRSTAARRRFLAVAVDAKAALLVETVIAVTVFVTVITISMVGISTAHKVSARTERQAIAENIARNQMEYVFSLDYVPPPTPYPATTTPAGYNATIQSAYLADFVDDPDIERITVEVTRNGEEVLSLETLRTNE